MDIKEKLKIITDASENKNGIDTKVINIKEITGITDYFVIVSGSSSIQAKTIADEIESQMEEAGFENVHKEGHQTGRWILLDYQDIIVHVFHKDEREYYNLERLWTDGIEEKYTE